MWGWRVREGKSISKSGRRDRWTSDYKLCAESRSVWFILFDPVSFIRVFPLSISDGSGINTSILFFLKKNCLLFLHEPTCLTCKKLGFILFHFQVVKPSAYDLHLGSFRSSCLQLSLTNASSRKVTNPFPSNSFSHLLISRLPPSPNVIRQTKRGSGVAEEKYFISSLVFTPYNSCAADFRYSYSLRVSLTSGNRTDAIWACAQQQKQGGFQMRKLLSRPF